jgi:hypothetical protein
VAALRALARALDVPWRIMLVLAVASWGFRHARRHDFSSTRTATTQ